MLPITLERTVKESTVFSIELLIVETDAYNRKTGYFCKPLFLAEVKRS